MTALTTAQLDDNDEIDRLRTALTDAFACWRHPCLTTREKERKDEIWSLLNDDGQTHQDERDRRLATAHDMIRHLEQERDAWGAAYKQRAAKTDARIKELEAGLREALSLVRHEPTWLSEDEVAVAARLRTLIPSEDK